MQAFQALFHQLDQVTGTRAKVSLLVEHFRSVPAADAAWSLALLLGKRRRRLITGRRLRTILEQRGGICLLYTSPSPRDKRQSRMPSSA